MSTEVKKPQFGGQAPKCKNCSSSVYPIEKIEYDGQVYHQACFKRLQCKNVVGLSAVAMIQGDLYCKNCFLRIFSKEGRYSSFGDKTLPKVSAGRASISADNTATATNTTAATSTTNTSTSSAATTTHTASTVKRSSISSDSASPVLQSLFDAISAKQLNRVGDIVNASTGVELFFSQHRGQSPIEAAFNGVQNSRACGQLMLDVLQKRFAELEAKINSNNNNATPVAAPVPAVAAAVDNATNHAAESRIAELEAQLAEMRIQVERLSTAAVAPTPTPAPEAEATPTIAATTAVTEEESVPTESPVDSSTTVNADVSTAVSESANAIAAVAEPALESEVDSSLSAAAPVEPYESV